MHSVLSANSEQKFDSQFSVNRRGGNSWSYEDEVCCNELRVRLPFHDNSNQEPPSRTDHT